MPWYVLARGHHGIGGLRQSLRLVPWPRKRTPFGFCAFRSNIAMPPGLQTVWLRPCEVVCHAMWCCANGEARQIVIGRWGS